jgi:small subunit ribosomal protein S19
MARSMRKGPYVEESLLVKVQRAKQSNKREPIKTWSRRSMVIPDFVGMTFAIHNGKKFNSVFITENMVGHYLGEFSPSRKFIMHSGQRQSGGSSEK